MAVDTMRAARFERADRRLTVVEDMPVPEPGPGEVLVRIEACGICLSDVHVIDGTLPCPLERVTPGHEPAGTTARVAPDVPYWRPGQRVVIAPGRPCGSCPHCGDELSCLARRPDERERAAAMRELTGLLARGIEGSRRIPRGPAASGGTATVRVVVAGRPGELGRLLSDAGAAGVRVDDVTMEHGAAEAPATVHLTVGAGAAPGLAAALRRGGWEVAG